MAQEQELMDTQEDYNVFVKEFDTLLDSLKELKSALLDKQKELTTDNDPDDKEENEYLLAILKQDVIELNEQIKVVQEARKHL